MSTTALHVIELVKSLPEADQTAIRDALTVAGQEPGKSSKRRLQRRADGGYVNPNGMPDHDPVFKILDEIEEERHRTQGPASPRFE